MIETMFVIILTPIAALAAVFTACIAVGVVKGIVQSFKNLRK